MNPLYEPNAFDDIEKFEQKKNEYQFFTIKKKISSKFLTPKCIVKNKLYSKIYMWRGTKKPG